MLEVSVKILIPGHGSLRCLILKCFRYFFRCLLGRGRPKNSRCLPHWAEVPKIRGVARWFSGWSFLWLLRWLWQITTVSFAGVRSRYSATGKNTEAISTRQFAPVDFSEQLKSIHKVLSRGYYFSKWNVGYWTITRPVENIGEDTRDPPSERPSTSDHDRRYTAVV